MRKLLLVAACLVIPAFAAAPGRAESDAQTVVYLGESGPVIIRLHMRLDGKPFRERYEAFISKLFKELDRDGDGVLNREEMASAPPPSALSPGSIFFAERTTIRPMPRRDGKTTREQLAAHYASAGLKPFQISSRPRESGVIRLDLVGSGPRSAAEVNKRVLELLDTNKDGKISRAELAAAERVMGKLDRDEDEMVTLDELLRSLPPADGEVAITLVDASGMPAGDTPFHLVAGTGPDEVLATRLLKTYGGKGATELDAKKIGLGEGMLKAADLARLGTRPPHIEIAVRLGKRGDKPAVEVLKSTARKGVTVEKKGGRVTLRTGKVVLELGEMVSEENIRFAAVDPKAQYENAFAMADADNNGYLDKAEGMRHPLFRAAFAAMDRDGDGMLYLKEVLAYVDRMKALREMATASCLSLLVTEQGEGLFSMLDTDGDGRLSVREMRAAGKLLDKLEAEADGTITLASVPRQYRGNFERGAIGMSAGGARAFVAVFGGGMPTPTRETRRGPAWFRKMDRNGDGDVSRKEFLGTDEQFRAIDADGDGLISATEAEAYEKRMSRK